MENLNIMEKSDMTISSSNPLIKQISPQKKIRNKIYITYNICETCNLNCLFCCINDIYHGKKSISIENSDTILNELRNNYDINNFAFHCMSVSGRATKNGLNHLNAFKWRKLVTDLFKIKKQLKNINEFSVPIIAMTENELLKLYFGGDIKLLNDFLLRKPIKMCPAINANNIYLKANNDDVYISRCQILFDNIGDFSYKFDYKHNHFKENLKNNDYDTINNSTTLCPVILTELNSKKDYDEDENGNKLYYVCRVLLADEKDLDYFV